jgi:uncharacterized protein with ATP-grasp and redox domains
LNIEIECIECIINQSRRVSEAINADDTLTNILITHVKEASKNFSFDQSPPEVAAAVYEEMALIASKNDLYDKQKELASTAAKKFYTFFER